jgi:hypothetical protein
MTCSYGGAGFRFLVCTTYYTYVNVLKIAQPNVTPYSATLLGTQPIGFTMKRAAQYVETGF